MCIATHNGIHVARTVAILIKCRLNIKWDILAPYTALLITSFKQLTPGDLDVSKVKYIQSIEWQKAQLCLINVYNISQNVQAITNCAHHIVHMHPEA